MAFVFNPRQTVLVSCRGFSEVMGKTTEKDELFSLEWHSPCSHAPPMYLICVNKIKEFAVNLIRGSGVFVINFLTFEAKEAVIKADEHSGEHIKKYEHAGLTMTEAQHMDCGRVEEAVGWMECQVMQEIDSGDHIIFLAKVLFADLKDPTAKRLFRVDKEEFTTTS